jgi:hypothetical protein
MELPESSGFYSKSSRKIGIRVKAKSLDEVIQEQRRINFIKIDVEGMEREILGSISEESWKKIKIAQVECHLGLLQIGDTRVIEMFQSRNYKAGVLMIRLFGKERIMLSPKVVLIAWAPMYFLLKALGKKGNTVANVYFQQRVSCE